MSTRGYGETEQTLCLECEGGTERELVLPSEEVTYSISDLFKVFGDATRLKILLALERRPMCGSHLAEHLGLTKAAISYQLKMLRQHDLVRSKKEGKSVIYRLSDDHVRAIIDCAIEHVNE